MGFLSELKKLFFVNKSVAKSAAEKTVQFGKDASGDILREAGEITNSAANTLSDKSKGIRDAILDNAESFEEKISSSELLTDLESKAKNIADAAKQKGEELAGKAKDAFDDFGDSETGKKLQQTTEDVGDKVLTAGEKFVEKTDSLKQTAEQKFKEASEVIGEKIGDISEDIKDKFDETVEKAQKFEEAEKLKPKGEFAETPLDASGSLLEDTDDFFSNAEKYADGDYGSFSEGRVDIFEEKVETGPKETVKAAGFEDLDGDGDEIIDDAIIEEE